MRRWRPLLGTVLVLVASSAFADWHEASSDHFVIYSDQNPEAIAAFSERLELFHAAMAHVFQQPNDKPSPSNRVTVFVLSDQAEVRKALGTDDRYLAGYYIPRAGAAVALVPTVRRASSQYNLSPEAILYHEYAHHFMFGLTSRSYPRWFNEGFAEFFAGVRYRPDSVGLGMISANRMMELAYAPNVPIRTLLDFDGGASQKKNGFDSFYGQSSMLFHYLQFAPERAGQLTRYESLLAGGSTALAAAEGAFGDLDKLAVAVTNYSNHRKMSYVVIGRTQLPIGPVHVRALTPGEAEIMRTRIESDVGVDEKEALSLLPEARRVAAKYPNEPAVLSALAEAEFDAGNDDQAIAAAERALTLDPGQMNAYIQKGYALSRKVASGVLPKEAWKDVRSVWVKANKVENDHPIPLVQFYITYVDQGLKPTETSIEGLEWAMALAPFDPAIRWQAAQQMIEDERLVDAARTLAPLAYSPHPGEHTDRALGLLHEVEGRIAAAAAAKPTATAAP